MVVDRPIEVADDIWWVGRRLPDDSFQCHAYLLRNGDDSVLFDPGSPLTIDDTLAKVEQLVDLSSVRYLVCHHPDPDIAASLPMLSERLTRPDVTVVTEWRAKALLKHYGHRFGYWLAEDNGWALELSGGRRVEFQLTPYLHFPGAFMSYDVATGTLFSSDLFGGFVPDSDVLVADDLDYVLDNARPFHQHYMPSSSLLRAGLARVQHRWPGIRTIAPQHGHVIPAQLVQDSFEGLARIECGVFALVDGDHDLSRLLRLAEARQQLSESLLTVADPPALVASLDAVLRHTHQASNAELFIDVPDDGWTVWRRGTKARVSGPPLGAKALVELAGVPVALLAITVDEAGGTGDEVLRMLHDMADSIRPAVDQYVAHAHDAHRIAALRRASQTDPLTGLGNRRALDAEVPAGDYALVSLDLDWFKRINDECGHANGDVVLRVFSGVIQSSIREGDHAYRLGGEEFLVVLPRADGPTGTRIAERIRQSLALTDFGTHAPASRVTVSAGVAAVTVETAESFVEALARADAALYASKDLGRDRVTLAT